MQGPHTNQTPALLLALGIVHPHWGPWGQKCVVNSRDMLCPFKNIDLPKARLSLLSHPHQHLELGQGGENGFEE
jgi:hypothetical protein